jgi:hypothetical protein
MSSDSIYKEKYLKYKKKYLDLQSGGLFGSNPSSVVADLKTKFNTALAKVSSAENKLEVASEAVKEENNSKNVLLKENAEKEVENAIKNAETINQQLNKAIEAEKNAIVAKANDLATKAQKEKASAEKTVNQLEATIRNDNRKLEEAQKKLTIAEEKFNKLNDTLTKEKEKKLKLVPYSGRKKENEDTSSEESQD